MADTPKWTSKAAYDFLKALGAVPAKPKPVVAPKPVTQAEKVMATVKNPGKAPAPAMGSFSSMNVPISDLKKAQAKPKATPWEERQDSVRRLSVKHQLVPEDQTLLDSFLYANRETRTGAKISPIESKATAPAFLVTQKAVNKANALLRTPEGRAKMAAEVAEFKAQRAMLAADRINQQFAPRVPQAPTLQASNIGAAESQKLSAQAQADREERSFRTATMTGRMMANVQSAAETVNKTLAPVSKGAAFVASAATPLGMIPAYRKGAEELMMSLPGGSLMAIPQGIVDLMATVDPDNKLDATKRLQTALGTVVNLGGAGIGAATLADDVARASKVLTNAMARGARVVPAVESNAAKLMVKQGPPLPPVEPVIPKPVQPEPVIAKPAEAVVPPVTVTAPKPAKAPKVNPAPAVAETVTQEAKQAVPESVPVSTTPPVSTDGKVQDTQKAPGPVSVNAELRAQIRPILDRKMRAIQSFEQTLVEQDGMTSEEAIAVTDWMLRNKMAKINGDSVNVTHGSYLDEDVLAKVKAQAMLEKNAAPTTRPAAKSVPSYIAKAKADIDRISKKKYKTRGDEIGLAKAQKRLALNPSKWEPGMGVGWKSVPGQTNKGYRVVSVDPDKGEAVIRLVADDGRTTYDGSNMVPIGRTETVDLIDLVRDKAMDKPSSPLKPIPADASARNTARADKAFRAKHGVGLGDEVTVTYQNGTTVEGTLSRNPAKARQGNEWMVGGKSIKPNAEGVTIKPKAQAVEACLLYSFPAADAMQTVLPPRLLII